MPITCINPNLGRPALSPKGHLLSTVSIEYINFT